MLLKIFLNVTSNICFCKIKKFDDLLFTNISHLVYGRSGRQKQASCTGCVRLLPDFIIIKRIEGKSGRGRTPQKVI